MAGSGVGSSRHGWRWRRHAGLVVVALSLLVGAGCSDGGGGDRTGSDEEPESTAERAPEGVVQVLMPEDVDVDLSQMTGAVGTETTYLTLLSQGEAVEIGRGRAARQPADGERFVVVELEKKPLEPVGAVLVTEDSEARQRGAATFGVQVEGGPVAAVNLDTPTYSPLPIDLENPPTPPLPGEPSAPLRRLLVVSVPEDARNVELVVTSAELEQRLSLLTGEPGPGNVAILARPNRKLLAPLPPQEVSSTLTEFGLSGSTTQPIAVPEAALQWAAGSGPTRRTAGPGRAILGVVFDTSGINYPLATELRLDDGTVVQPMPPEDDILAGTFPTVYFDVPADFTTGTVVLGKDYSWEVPTGGTMAADFANTVEYRIDIPLEAPA